MEVQKSEEGKRDCEKRQVVEGKMDTEGGGPLYENLVEVRGR